MVQTESRCIIGMGNLAQKFENTLWAVCPIPEWDYLCIEEQENSIIRVVLFTNGLPLDVPVVRDFDMNEVKKHSNKLESYCRKIVQETIMVIETSVGRTIDNMRSQK